MNRKRIRVAISRILSVFLLAGMTALQASDDAMGDRLQACSACHGRAVESPREEVYYPPIGGKPVEYLYQQLLNFKEGRRVNPTMQQMLAYLSPEYLHEIAAWYAAQPSVSPSALPASTEAGVETDPVRAARGRLLVQTGDGSQPACAACHSGDLAGDGIAIPGLRGLSAHYLTAQLGAWQAGTRHAREPDCMAEVARSLSGQDIDIVARWIAAAKDSDMTTVQVDRTKLPRDCGAAQ